METRYTYEITGDFLSFVEALEAVLRAEDKIEKAYILSYGEGGEVGEGEYMFKQTGTEGRLSEIKDELRDQISLSVEWVLRRKIRAEEGETEETDSEKPEEEK